MKRTTKHVALDVHRATTVASVREESGRVIARTIPPTEAGLLVEFFRGMRGRVQVAFEEGTQAQWLHDLLEPPVQRVVACDRRGSGYGLPHSANISCSVRSAPLNVAPERWPRRRNRRVLSTVRSWSSTT